MHRFFFFFRLGKEVNRENIILIAVHRDQMGTGRDIEEALVEILYTDIEVVFFFFLSRVRDWIQG